MSKAKTIGVTFSQIRQAMREGRAMASTGRWKRDQASRIANMSHGYGDCLLWAFVRSWRREFLVKATPKINERGVL